jgi:large subunit ribosomal protein L16
MMKKYNNIQKSKLQRYSNKTRLSFGTIGLKALESGYVTFKQIESAKQTILKKVSKRGKIWTKIVLNKPVTKKPLEVRMGKGKGNLSHKMARVRGGTLIFEICGLSRKTAISVFKTSGSKLPIKTGVFY